MARELSRFAAAVGVAALRRGVRPELGARRADTLDRRIARADTTMRRTRSWSAGRPQPRVSFRRAFEGAAEVFVADARRGARAADRALARRRAAADVVPERARARGALHSRRTPRSRRTRARSARRRRHRRGRRRAALAPTSTCEAGAIRLLTPGDSLRLRVRWSPDGRQIAVTYAKGNGDDNWWIARLARVDVATGAIARSARAAVSDRRSAMVTRRQAGSRSSAAS